MTYDYYGLILDNNRPLRPLIVPIFIVVIGARTSSSSTPDNETIVPHAFNLDTFQRHYILLLV